MENEDKLTFWDVLITLVTAAVILGLIVLVYTTISDSLEMSREATDAANIRTAYYNVLSETHTSAGENTVSDEEIYSKVRIFFDNKGNPMYQLCVPVTQKKSGWQSGVQTVAGAQIPDYSEFYAEQSPRYVVTYSLADDLFLITLAHDGQP